MLAPPLSGRLAEFRVLYYCHDSYGLGHLRRTLALAHHVRQRLPEATQLIVSGAAHSDGWTLPPGADWVKLPAVVKVGSGAYRARSLECSFQQTLALRGDVLLAAVRRFRPDVVVVDHVADGLKGEALPALRHAAAAGARLVLGLRDILDDATLVHRAWRQAGTHALLDGLYDRIVVYGDEEVYDVVEEYGFSPAAAAKTTYVGYLRAPDSPPRELVRARLGVGDERLLVVTAGGGGDGYSLISAALDSLAAAPLDGAHALVVTGPLMDGDERAELVQRAAACGRHVRIDAAVTDLADVISAADAVVSMGGYNTVREILTYGAPALIVPRVQPRLEQFVRAEALARRGLVTMLHPAELTAERLGSELRRLLAAPRRAVSALSLDGLDGFASTVAELVAPGTLEEALVGA
jgi:predicted glycosyltransferase